MIRAIDLCCGGGGWACAAKGLPIKIELAVDLWPIACKTYQLNHRDTVVICGDLREPAIRARVIADAAGVDLIVGGIPCEWLSEYRKLVKVKPHEIQAEQATLDSVLSLVKEIDPRFWCLEDVLGLVKHLPIFTPWTKIESSHFSAQRRKRIFVGNFPPPPRGKCTLTLADKIRPGPYRIGGRAFNREPVVRNSFNGKQSLAAHLHRKSPTMAAISSRRDAELVVVDERLPGGKRQIEWQEAAALQGFPDDYLFYGSPTDVALMVGRAVQIDTARSILQAIVNNAEREAKTPALEGAAK